MLFCLLHLFRPQHIVHNTPLSLYIYLFFIFAKFIDGKYLLVVIITDSFSPFIFLHSRAYLFCIILSVFIIFTF